MKNTEAVFNKDAAGKKIKVLKSFDAPVSKVWNAWTDSKVLDKWWAPEPWKAETRSMDFREGGLWLYAMVGPDGTKMWSRADYETIVPEKYFIGLDAFCDENGMINPEYPRMHWKVSFQKAEAGTDLEVEITFPTEKDMTKTLEMGFEEGFAMGLGNLTKLLAQ